MAWQASRSFKHELDIRDILTAARLGDDAEISALFDLTYIDQWAHKLGKDAERFQQNLKQLADYADKHHPTGTSV